MIKNGLSEYRKEKLKNNNKIVEQQEQPIIVEQNIIEEPTCIVEYERSTEEKYLFKIGTHIQCLKICQWINDDGTQSDGYFEISNGYIQSIDDEDDPVYYIYTENNSYTTFTEKHIMNIDELVTYQYYTPFILNSQVMVFETKIVGTDEHRYYICSELSSSKQNKAKFINFNPKCNISFEELEDLKDYMNDYSHNDLFDTLYNDEETSKKLFYVKFLEVQKFYTDGTPFMLDPTGVRLEEIVCIYPFMFAFDL